MSRYRASTFAEPPAVRSFRSLDAHGRVLDLDHLAGCRVPVRARRGGWTLGDPCLHVHGGLSRLSGRQTVVSLPPIIAARGHASDRGLCPTPALTNTALFARDAQLCLYCGERFSRRT